MNYPSHVRTASCVVGIIALLLSHGTVYAGEKVRGSGVVRTEQRLVPHFTTIESACTASVIIECGEHDSIVVEAEDNILPLIETKVADRKLRLTTKDNVSISTTRGITFRITARELRGVAVSGSGSVVAKKVHAKAFSIDVSGTGKVTTYGRAQSVNISISGSGGAHTLGMPVRTAEVSVTGNAKIVVHAAERLIADIVGNGYVEYAGEPHVTRRITGTGRVSAIRGP